MMSIIDKIIENFNNFFSMIFFIVVPKFPIRKAIKKNLDPLVNVEIIIKYKILKFTKPLVIVKSLNGTGVKPAIAKRVSHATTPPSDETLSFKKDVLSTPYNSKIFNPISLKKTYPIKYPRQAPATEPMVAIRAMFSHSFLLAIVIGMIKTSGGIGKMKLSTNEITPKKNFELLCPANFKDL